MRRYIAFITLILSSWAALAADGNTPTFAMSGDVTLLSHYVEDGLSQTDKAPSLQGSFWFNFGPQFRLGAWASNTKYPDSEDNFNLRGIGELTISFSPSSHASLSYARSQYYNGGDRNGNLLALDIVFMTDYQISYETNSNWEGTGNSSKRYGFGKTFTVFGDWKWANEIGYNDPSSNDFNPYFDGRTGIGKKWGVIFFEGSVTGTSESSQFHGAGDVFFILSAKTGL